MISRNFSFYSISPFPFPLIPNFPLKEEFPLIVETLLLHVVTTENTTHYEICNVVYVYDGRGGTLKRSANQAVDTQGKDITDLTVLKEIQVSKCPSIMLFDVSIALIEWII
ncbi:hypothetical protein WA026_022760 [Henosepilachna vigintioctopunctata]|uniref:Uncharacterized protein n=1 Tax=Henosepilachna vigintioctopunctata TaxID=420089 RepID=A0AAW1UI33_9CUCU